MRTSGLRAGVAVGLGVIGLIGTTASAAPVTVSLTPSKDNSIYEDAAGALSSGKATSLYVGRTGPRAGQIRQRGLVRFDFSGIPADAVVSGATLTLTVGQAGAGDPNSIALHRLIADWGEGESGAAQFGGGGSAAATGDATWLHRFYTTQSWATAGGDFVATPSGTAPSVAGGSTPTISAPGMAADVQAWVNNPAANFGWALVGNEASNTTALQISSREAASAAARPTLTVTYDVVPEPAAAAMLLAAALPLLARRRQRAR